MYECNGQVREMVISGCIYLYWPIYKRSVCVQYPMRAPKVDAEGFHRSSVSFPGYCLGRRTSDPCSLSSGLIYISKGEVIDAWC